MRRNVQDRLSVAPETATSAVGRPLRKDGRRPLLVYLDPALIKELKKEALDRDINVYELVEEMLKKQMARSVSAT